MEQSMYAGWTLVAPAPAWDASGRSGDGTGDGTGDEIRPTTSQTREVFPVPLDPMQKIGGGTYKDEEEDSDEDAIT